MKLGHNQAISARQIFSCTELLQLCRDVATRQLVDRISKVANARSVLLCGESGVGKEVVAKAIHEQGERRNATLVIVQCGASNEDLMAAALFGNERGAYTGAHEARPGAFEKGHNGTVYLDEVARLQPRVQGMLLRALEGESISRLGSTTPLKVDFRLIAATNRNLTTMVSEGEFAKDLFYRLNAVPLKVPPLRERQEDVVRLARLFADQAGKTLEPEAEELFKGRSWPGNIRELRNVIERASMFAGDNPTIRTKDVEFDEVFVFDDGSQTSGTKAGNELNLQDENRLLRMMSDFITNAAPHVTTERSCVDIADEFMVRAALERTGGNKLAAAKLLGWGRQTLYNKLGKYNIPI